MNDLTGKVQVVNLPMRPLVAWYHPAGFPDIVTDAELVDGDEGGALLIHNGWAYKVICAEQVVSITSSRAHGWREMREQEQQEFDQLNERA